MQLASGIRKHGFRKWYERELIQSHLHLVLLLMCTIGILGAFEVFSRAAPWSDQVVNVLAILVCSAIGVWALRRYFYLLLHAESIANQANCPKCEVYGRFTVASEDSSRGEVTVQCRKCAHQWPIAH